MRLCYHNQDPRELRAIGLGQILHLEAFGVGTWPDKGSSAHRSSDPHVDTQDQYQEKSCQKAMPTNVPFQARQGIEAWNPQIVFPLRPSDHQ